MFITLEGIDGVGKSTQAQKLVDQLIKQGLQVVHTREPGGTALGRAVRHLLLAETGEQVNPKAELLLYAADRAQHVATVIRPALADNKLVVSERYADSTLAYQGYGLQFSTAFIQGLHEWSTDGLMPDLTIILDLDVTQALRKTGGDRIEQRTIAYHQRVRAGYQAIAAQSPERVVIISGAGTMEQVFGRLWRIVEGRLAQ